MSCSLYEHPAWENIPNQTMHPGGVRLTEQVLNSCNLSPDTRVLDVGCGMGATLQYLQLRYGVSGFGIDISATLLMRALKAGKIDLAQAHCEELPFACGCMELIISECSLSVFNTDEVLQECSRVLRQGGCLVINDLYVRNPNGIGALQELSPNLCLTTIMTHDEIVNKTMNYGFLISSWQDCSENLKTFPISEILTTSEADPFEVLIAARKARLGYYAMTAIKT